MLQKTEVQNEIWLLFLFVTTGFAVSDSLKKCGGAAPHIEYTEIEVNKRGPMRLWEAWYVEAKTRSENIVPETMSMSTVQKNGRPASRSLLLRGYNESGFKIYTDYTSPKAQELAGNNWTALVFLWFFVPKGEVNATGTRQVRVEGTCTKLTQKENMEYFETEPIDSQARAYVQRQSKCIGGTRKHEILIETRKLLALAQCPGFKFPFPEHWGGYLIRPQTMEFYQNDPKSIGDRIKFKRRKDLDDKNDGRPCRRHNSEDDWIYERLEV